MSSAIAAALAAVVAGLIIAGTVDVPSIGDDAEVARPAVNAPGMRQSDPPLPTDRPRTFRSVDQPAVRYDAPLPSESRYAMRESRDVPLVQYESPLAGEGRDLSREDVNELLDTGPIIEYEVPTAGEGRMEYRAE